MANIPEDDSFPDGVYQIEQTDPVLGGAPNAATGAGLVNVPAQQLARRTRWLKTRVDQLVLLVVAASATVAGIVRLTDGVTSNSTTTAATANSARLANTNAESRALKTTRVNAQGLASGGGAIGADITVTVADASQAEAEAGTISDKAMSPLRVAQAIAARLAGRTVAAAGLATGGGPLSANQTITVPDATQAEAEARTSAAKAMSPLRTGQAIVAAFSQSLVENGHCRLPNGLILQWGRGFTLEPGIRDIVFPIAFPNATLAITMGDNSSNLSTVDAHIISTNEVTQTGFKAMATRHDGTLSASAFSFFAIGR